MIHFKENKNKSALSTRWAQMSKQEQIIEKKKMEIQAKLEAQKNAAALAAQAKLANPAPPEEAGSQNIFSNDGSFMTQYKALLDKQNRENREREAKEKQERQEKQDKQEKNDELQRKKNEGNKQKSESQQQDEVYGTEKKYSHERRSERHDGRHRERNRRWSDRSRNRTHSPYTPTVEDRKTNRDTNHIPSLMQISVMPPDQSPPGIASSNWNAHDDSDSNDDYESKSKQDFENYGSDSGQAAPDPVVSAPPPPDFMNPLPMGPIPMGPGTMGGPGPMGPGPLGFGHMGPGPMGPGPMGPGPMVPGCMGPGPMGPGPMGPMGPGPMGLRPMGPGPMGPGPMGPGPMGPGPMGPGQMGPGPMGSGPMGSGPIRPGAMGSGPMGPGLMGSNPMPPGTMGQASSMNLGAGPDTKTPKTGPNMGSGNANISPNMGSKNPNMPPNMPGNQMPFMGGPPNFPMPPNFGGPNGGCGPGPMPPNMCGPNLRGPGPTGHMPPFFPSNGPPNSMMPPNAMNNDSRFMGPPFGPNGPNFGPNGPNFGPNGPNFGPNGPNFGPNGPNFGPSMGGPNMPFMPPNSMPMPPMMNEQKPESMPSTLKHPPLPPMLPKEHESNIPPPPNKKVLSADTFQSSVHRAAAEVASNGDHWESVLKMNLQDQSMWFLHNTNSNEYKMYRDLLNKMRNEGHNMRRDEINPEDKYEPEFSLEDDDSNDNKPNKEDMDSNFYSNYQDNPYQFNSGVKREASSQSDDEGDMKRERRKKRKSRWGDDPPVDIKPPGMATIPPPPLPGAQLSKIDGDGIKLTTLNRNNQALMQYAMTNYGTVNLSPEDWQKCEDNFKLNLLFQDMLKKRQEVERLAAAGRHKYEYDSDEDTKEGTWEHKMRAKEMNATEKWADELTKQAAGKHHIGDFLPPEELKRFMEKYSAVKSGKEPDLSDYKEYKLREDNLGFKMLQKLGWNEGQGLGAEGTGIVEPINKSNQPGSNMGLGAKTSDVVSSEDDEFDAYRKRMMLAYRFRPNPLNNPRRPYY